MVQDNLSRHVYASLTDRILRLQYPPEHRLTEEALCAEFGVSRSPVREALGMLAESGLVDKKARQGYTVRRLDLREIEELYEVRLVLELAVVERLCAKGMSAVELDRLERFWRELYDRLPAMPERLPESDEEFHATLARAAGNAVLEQMLRFVDGRIHFVRLGDITSPERLEVSALDHLSILAAIRNGDVGGGTEAMRRNIERGRNNVEAALKEALIRAHRIR